MKVDRICKKCSKEFKTKLRPNRGFYCSKHCSNKAKIGVSLKHPEGHGLNVSKGKKGKPVSEAHRLAIIKVQKTIGNKHRHYYIDGRMSNPEYMKWSNQAWKRRKREADGTHTFDQWQNLKAQCNWTCVFCRRREPEIKLTEDHIIPLSKGGSDNIENIQPLCRSCNSKKKDKVLTN